MKRMEVIHMAIEPIGTMTAMQVQSTVKVQPVDTTVKSADTEINAAQAAVPKVDATTLSVAKTAESDAQGQEYSEQREPDLDQIKKAVDDMNKKMSNSEAVFGIHEGTNRVTIKIVDKKTKEVIKELPPEKTLDMISKVWEMAGILVDEKR
jgi:flagellar protein FlaG